jgi:methionine aminotransferase
MREGRNQYPPMAGVPELRAAIADKVAALYGASYDVEAKSPSPPARRRRSSPRSPPFVRSGDEVIVFEPVYDSYVPAIETVGGKAVYAALGFPDYRPDWQQVRSLISPRRA